MVCIQLERYSDLGCKNICAVNWNRIQVELPVAAVAAQLVC